VYISRGDELVYTKRSDLLSDLTTGVGLHPMKNSPEFVLEARGLTKAFDDRVAVDGVNLSLGVASVYGLLGRNGAGKTTLLRMILGLLTPDAGSLRLFGREAAAGDVDARQGLAGFVEEPCFYPNLSAQRNLELLAMLDGAPRAGAAISPAQALDLMELADRARDKVGGFSTGMRQRLGLAAALVRAPRLLVLDEPTIGLDPANAAAVRTLLRDRADSGVAVLVSSHNMTEVAEICDRVLIMREGREVWEGSQADLQAAAPVPAWRVWTSDDARAANVAGSVMAEGLRVETDVRRVGGAPLLVHALDEPRDKLVLALAREGVAVRKMEPDTPPLEALFAVLTGADPAADEAVAA
jgi:ABC-2 type transport system ATP-binding protein